MTKRKNKPEKTPVKARNNNEKKLTRLQVGQSFQGPIPPPEVLFAYNSLDSGFANRILKMAEAESRHRHEIENKAISADIEFMQRDYKEARVGQVLAFLIAVFSLSGSFYVAVNGAQWTGSLVGAGSIFGLVTAFIYGRKKLEVKKAAHEAKARKEESKANSSAPEPT